jgi:hypothetical protein
MYYCVMLVVEDPDQSSAVLEAWEAAGIFGVTILHTAETAGKSGRFSALEGFLRGHELRHRTLFSLVPDEAHATRLADAARQAMGEFDEERTGLLIVLPVSRVYGLEKSGANTSRR